MITKFVGSPTDLNNVKRIALVYSSSILLESQINQFYPSYFGNNLKYIIDATEVSNEEYTNKFILSNFDPFEFNAIIFYDPGMNPIGFTMLDQSVDTSQYKIGTIVIIPNFIIDLAENRYIEVVLGETNYSEHVANTDKVHKKLFRTDDYALNPDKVDAVESNPTKFTNQLKEAIQSDRVYRYAGNFSMINNRLLQSNYSINYNYTPIIDTLGTYRIPNGKSITIKSKWNRIFKINNHYYFITYNGTNLVIKGLDNSVNITKAISGLVQFGSNIYVTYSSSSSNLGYSIYSTSKLLDNEQYLLSKVHESLINTIRFTRCFDDESIHPYNLSVTGPTMITNKMKDLFSRIKVDRYMSSITEIIGFSKNLLIYKIENSNTTYILSDISISTPNGVVNSVPFRYEFAWDQLEVVSNKAILIHKTSSKTWKLFQIVPVDLSKIVYKNIIYELGTTNNWRKLDFIAKTQINPNNLNILMSPIDGNLWKYTTSSNNITFSTL